MSAAPLQFVATVRASAGARSLENGNVAVLVLEIPLPAPALAPGVIYRVQMRRAARRTVRSRRMKRIPLIQPTKDVR